MNGKSPYISVVIPTYSDPDTLGVTLKSLMQQSLQADEIVVVDDCGDIPASDILKDSFPDVKIIRHDVNKGVHFARNTGYAEVSGEFIFFLDADDILFPDFLENAVRALEKNQDAAVCFGNFYRCLDGNPEPYIQMYRKAAPEIQKYQPNEGIVFYLENTGAFIPSFTIIRRTMLEDVSRNGQVFFEDVWGNEDFHLFVRLLANFPVMYIKNEQGVYFIQPSSLSRNYQKVWLSRCVAMNSLVSLAKEKRLPHIPVSTLAKHLHVASRKYAMSLLRAGERKAAKEFLAQKIRQSPNAKSIVLYMLMGLRIY
ncbi:MAG: glycosyltransferase [Sneathiella sp.]|nr:glycosyltransferase [Sneathiella sp.]